MILLFYFSVFMKRFVTLILYGALFLKCRWYPSLCLQYDYKRGSDVWVSWLKKMVDIKS